MTMTFPEGLQMFMQKEGIIKNPQFGSPLLSLICSILIGHEACRYLCLCHAALEISYQL
jgi:hypothetical protein